MSIAAYKTKAGLKPETSIYGIASTVSTGNQIAAISKAIQEAGQLSLERSFSQDRLFPERMIYQGSVGMQLHYFDAALLALGLGFSHFDNSPASLGSGAYRHYFEPDWSFDDRLKSYWDKSTASGVLQRRGTFCFDENGDIWEYTSCYVQSLKLDFSSGNIKAAVDILTPQASSDSNVNIASSSWSFPSVDEAVYFDQMKIYLWPRDIFALSTSKTLYFDEGAGAIFITVPAGVYYGSELAKVIADLMYPESAFDARYQGHYDWVHRRFMISSNVFFKITSAGTINSIAGFTGSAYFANVQSSEVMAKADNIAMITSSQLVNVLSLSLEINNKLAVREDSNTGNIKPLIISNGDVQVSGNIVFSRYSETIGRALRGRDPFCLKAELTGNLIGGSNYQKMEIYLPAVILQGDSAIPASGVIRPTATLNGGFPSIVDTNNILQTAYHVRNFNVSTHTVRSVGAYYDELYMGTILQKLLRVTNNGRTITDITGMLTGIPNCFQTFRNKLYIGCDNGKIYNWDGTTLTLKTTIGSGSDTIDDLCVFDGTLYVLIGNSGNIYRSADGTTYTLTHTGAGISYRLLPYKGAIYALINGDIYRSTNGTTFSSYYDFTNAPAAMSMCIHGGVLWAFSDNKGAWSSGGTFTATATLGNNVKHAESFMGHVIILENGTNKDIFRLDILNESLEAVHSGFDRTMYYKPLVFRRKLLIPVTTAGELRYIEHPKEILIALQNRVSTNPLA